MQISRTMGRILRNPEFQSSSVRLAIWCFSFVYIGLGSASGHYLVDSLHYDLLFGGFLIVFIALAVSIVYRADWRGRRYFSLVMDILATSLCIYLTKEAISPFYLLYIWIFLSYGTRYGSTYLRVASILSVLAYTLLLIALKQWTDYLFEAVFFLLLLVLLPLYQFMLLRKLHEAKLEAEQSNRAKSAFLSSMTHELRTPISGILGMAHLLNETPINSDQREYIHSITQSAQNLDTLIGDVLDLSRVEAAGIELREDQVNLSRLVRDVAIALSNHALEKEVELICDIQPNLPNMVILDALRLRQVLSNLISNAIKFTHQGEVEISVSIEEENRNWEESHLLFKIRDTGIGLSEEQMRLVFERFWQADGTATTQQGGVGLGAAIVQSLVSCMAGSIGVESQQGEGCVFSVRLPLRSSEVEQISPDASSPQLGTGPRAVLIFEPNERVMGILMRINEAMGLKVFGVAQVSKLAATLDEIEAYGGIDFVIIGDSSSGTDVNRVAQIIRLHVSEVLPVLYLGYRGRPLVEKNRNSKIILKPIIAESIGTAISELIKTTTGDHEGGCRGEKTPVQVLMAEDNAINAKVLGALLDELGCVVQWAKDGEEALKIALSRRFDIAFVDLRMPKLDGLAFTRDYRASESHDRMPIVALTASTTGDSHQQCMEAGMDDFLAKPVDSNALRSVLECYAN